MAPFGALSRSEVFVRLLRHPPIALTVALAGGFHLSVDTFLPRCPANVTGRANVLFCTSPSLAAYTKSFCPLFTDH